MEINCLTSTNKRCYIYILQQINLSVQTLYFLIILHELQRILD